MSYLPQSVSQNWTCCVGLGHKPDIFKLYSWPKTVMFVIKIVKSDLKIRNLMILNQGFSLQSVSNHSIRESCGKQFSCWCYDSVKETHAILQLTFQLLFLEEKLCCHFYWKQLWKFKNKRKFHLEKRVCCQKS